MKLIDRYVYAVTQHLPENTREDVARELRANIEDMLPEGATEKEVREVLEKLGNPAMLASEYGDSKRYLIGPELYDNYISILKLVVVIVASVVGGIALLEGVLSPSVGSGLISNIIEIFVDVLVGAIEGAVQGFLWVTLVFVILERTGVNRIGVSDSKIKFLKDEWSIEDLPEPPVQSKGSISRGEALFSMIVTIVFTAVLYFKPEVIAMYRGKEGGTILEIPLFVTEVLKAYMPVLILLALFQFSIYVWKFVTRRWNIPLAVINTVCNMAVCVLMYIMVKDRSLFNTNFLAESAELLTISTSKINLIWSQSTTVFAAVFIAICIWDSISGFVKIEKE